jgi:hypothetical protein
MSEWIIGPNLPSHCWWDLFVLAWNRETGQSTYLDIDMLYELEKFTIVRFHSEALQVTRHTN